MGSIPETEERAEGADRSMTEYSVHRVKRVRIAPATDLGCAYSRRIVITDEDDNTHAVIVFADTVEELEVKDGDWTGRDVPNAFTPKETA